MLRFRFDDAEIAAQARDALIKRGAATVEIVAVDGPQFIVVTSVDPFVVDGSYDDCALCLKCICCCTCDVPCDLLEHGHTFETRCTDCGWRAT